MGALRADRKDYQEPPVRFHQGRRTMPRLVKRLDFLTEREYLLALTRDLKRHLDVERARTDHAEAKARLYLAKAARYAGMLDQVNGTTDEGGLTEDLEQWLEAREQKLRERRAKKGSDHAATDPTAPARGAAAE